jgi:uncharacterized membrane protein YjjP (DUF1212 family)
VNPQREQLIAYLATLCTLVLVFIAALIAGAMAPVVLGKFEAFGLGTITGGLIGVLRIPASRSVTVDNAANDPVPVEPKS